VSRKLATAKIIEAVICKNTRAHKTDFPLTLSSREREREIGRIDEE
jgi:hypothetical protein